jgi:hypothetical protein
LVRIESDRPLVRYRFGKATADFLLCPCCGTFAAATFEHGGNRLATINAVGLQISSLATSDAEPVSYDDEDAETRQARRQVRWMPTLLIERSLN